MSKIKTGGPTFPRPFGCVPDMGGTYSKSQSGMSMRAYFAGKAMQGLCAALGVAERDEEIARMAVRRADALIAELERGA